MPQEMKDRLTTSHARYVRAWGEVEKERQAFLSVLLEMREAGATNQEIGDVLGVTRQRVSQLLGKVER